MTITVKLSDANTQAALNRTNSKICLFRAQQNSALNAAPLVLFTESNVLMENTFTVNNTAYDVYISEQQLLPGKQIHVSAPVNKSPVRGRMPLKKEQNIFASTSITVQLGDAITIDKFGNLKTTGSTANGELSIINTSEHSYLTGVRSSVNSNKSFPFTAQKILPQTVVKIKPLDTYLVLITNDISYKNGSYIVTTSGAGILIEGQADSTFSIIYDLNTTWKDNTEGWASLVSVGSNLRSTLVTPL